MKSLNVEHLYPLIWKFNMNKEEAEAWKLSITYLYLAQKYIPEYSQYRISKKDPRKSLLFRCCMKLLREYKSLLKPEEFLYFLKAQFEVLKNIKDKNNVHAMIHPNCLVGSQAWKRWLVWKKQFNNTLQHNSVEEVGVKVHNDIEKQLLETKSFLEKNLKTLTAEIIVASLENRILFRWCLHKKITPYYLCLSPIVQQWIQKTKTNLLDAFALDLNFYRKGITQQVKDFFQLHFHWEKI